MDGHCPYMLNLRHPEVEKVCRVYRRRKGIPLWCPFSDAQRLEFELFFMERRLRRDYSQWLEEYTPL